MRVTYDEIYAEVEKLGIESQSEKYRTRIVLTGIILRQIKHPDEDVNDTIAIVEASVGDMNISARKSREQLEEKLHRSDLPEELLAGDVLSNTIDYVLENLHIK